MDFPLEGVQVISLEQAVAAPLASRHLADLGATVIKIERPGSGDFARQYDSSVHGVSSNFVWLNRGKQSLTLNFKKPAGREILEKLLDRADVLITNLSQRTLERADLLPEKVRSDRPKMIYCLISGYGASGPYRHRKAYDLLLQGESGLISVSGSPEQAAKVGVSLVDISAGVYAAMSILAALLHRNHTDEGTWIDISLLETSAEWMGSPLSYFLGSGRMLARAGTRHNLIVPYGPYRCREGAFINLAIQNQAEWRRFCEMVLERPDLVDDPRFTRNEDRLANRILLEPLIEGIFSEMDRRQLIQRLERAGIAWGDVNDVSGLENHAQLEARQRWSQILVNGSPFKVLNHPMNIIGMPTRASPVPTIGEHTSEILHSLGIDDERARSLREDEVL